jgi:threonine/homoserine/homoserine lactone efflux protein
VGNAVLAYMLYGVGMAATLGVLTVLAGIVSFEILSRVRSVGRVVSVVGAVLLLYRARTSSTTGSRPEGSSSRRSEE